MPKNKLRTVNDLVWQGHEKVTAARESGNQKDIDEAIQFLTDKSLDNAIAQMNAKKDQLSALMEDSSEQLVDAVKNMMDEIDASHQMWLQELKELTQIQSDLINTLL
ncbi:MAG: hypothetical protein OXC48_09470 [Endozoicomonadaceae bacterium]|nr:hypothetical protein [Endozoicomonadaceae bacterium]